MKNMRMSKKINSSDSLMELNMELICSETSKEYYVGKSICSSLRALKNGNISFVISKVLMKILGLNKRIKQSLQTSHNPNDFNGRFACYSCIVDGYDTILEPLYTNPNCDFILFSDENIDINESAWEIYKINKAKSLLDS